MGGRFTKAPIKFVSKFVASILLAVTTENTIMKIGKQLREVSFDLGKMEIKRAKVIKHLLTSKNRLDFAIVCYHKQESWARTILIISTTVPAVEHSFSAL